MLDYRHAPKPMSCRSIIVSLLQLAWPKHPSANPCLSRDGSQVRQGWGYKPGARCERNVEMFGAPLSLPRRLRARAAWWKGTASLEGICRLVTCKRILTRNSLAGKMMRITVGCGLLGVLVLASGCGGATTDDTAALSGLRAAEENLDRLRERVETQERLVDSLDRLSACQTTDRECRRKPMQDVQSVRRLEVVHAKKARDSEPMAARLTKVLSFSAPNLRSNFHRIPRQQGGMHVLRGVQSRISGTTGGKVVARGWRGDSDHT